MSPPIIVGSNDARKPLIPHIQGNNFARRPLGEKVETLGNGPWVHFFGGNECAPRPRALFWGSACWVPFFQGLCFGSIRTIRIGGWTFPW